MVSKRTLEAKKRRDQKRSLLEELLSPDVSDETLDNGDRKFREIIDKYNEKGIDAITKEDTEFVLNYAVFLDLQVAGIVELLARAANEQAE